MILMCRFPLKSYLLFSAFSPIFLLLGFVVGQWWKTEHLVNKFHMQTVDELKHQPKKLLHENSIILCLSYPNHVFFNQAFLFYDCYALLLYFNKTSAAKCWLKEYTVKLFERMWQAAISVTLCRGRGSLSPDLLLSPWSQVTICLHGIVSVHGDVKCWQKPYSFPEELRTLVNNLTNVFTPSSTTKVAEHVEHSLWQLKAMAISSQPFPPVTMRSLEKKNEFDFLEEDKRMPDLYLFYRCAIEVTMLV